MVTEYQQKNGTSLLGPRKKRIILVNFGTESEVIHFLNDAIQELG